jgi:hypothetical protein
LHFAAIYSLPITRIFSADKNYGGGYMNKREKYVSLELSGDNLDKFVVELREKILSEFWPEIPVGQDRDLIKCRLERSILNALEFENEEKPCGPDKKDHKRSTVESR